ncbi:MAG TPA: hybrid sensor histidine kinase/response regulator [Nitrospirae bacterium]|nr:sensor protein ZraS [bacterium BMS3Abin06]HDH12163.1 hybrid sensor histidine kinase/response regulator [Nitrospirota bacterium]HDZ02144.1 hybrid sensor histidine kinase/response regulator [Nitrospirota bacterium]
MSEGERQNILIVDDRPENLLALEALLEGPAQNIVKATSGNAALGLMLEYDFALVLLDVQMPDMNGFETAELMRGNERTKYVPIIFVTAISKEQKYIFKGYEVGAVDYLFKPLDPDILKSKVNIFLELHRKAAELKGAHEVIESEHKEVEKAYAELKATQAKILQQEKMASIGQLAAGVAHEINNPMGFISSNLGTLGKYVNKLTEFIDTQTGVIESLKSTEASEGLKDKRRKLKLDYILEDIEELIKESIDGAERVKKIVQNLKSFSRIDEAEYKNVDINECIENTLNIVRNELKYKAEIKKDYGKLPPADCYPQQLNQVFMNLLVNAAQAIEKQGEIGIRTWNGDGIINVSISDTGCGIPEDKISRIFEPFFTTKDVGKGTGLGLSITYDIVKKHKGEITVESEAGKGSTFTVKIPVAEGQ